MKKNLNYVLAATTTHLCSETAHNVITEMQNENSFLYSFFTSPSHSKEEKDIKFKNELEKLVEIQENYEKCKIVISMLCSIPPGIYQPQSDMVEIFTALIGILHFDISQLILQKLPKLLYNCQLKGKKLSQLLDKVLLAFTEIIDQDRKYLVPIIGALSQFTLTTRHQRIVLTTAMVRKAAYFLFLKIVIGGL